MRRFIQAVKMTIQVQPLESLSKKPEEPKIIVNLRRIKRKIMIDERGKEE